MERKRTQSRGKVSNADNMASKEEGGLERGTSEVSDTEGIYSAARK